MRLKRIFDLSISIALIVILWPLLLVTCFLVRITIGSPIFFRQLRPGLNCKPFVLFKFRTMLNSYDNNGVLLSDSKRFTPLGNFLRSTSIDELPELINVIKGEMSLVGPRPLLMEYLPLYSERQLIRHNVKPGITGWAQVNGRNTLNWEQKFELDLWYVQNQNFWLDIKIIFITFYKILRRDGINANKDVTMPLFSGSLKNDNE